MNAFTCDRCGFDAFSKRDLKRHCLRKFKCNPLVSDISQEEVYEKYFSTVGRFKCDATACNVYLNTPRIKRLHHKRCRHIRETFLKEQEVIDATLKEQESIDTTTYHTYCKHLALQHTEKTPGATAVPLPISHSTFAGELNKNINNSNTKSGIVYMLQPAGLVGTNRYKIGCSSLGGSIKRCQHYGIESQIVCVIAVKEPYVVEKHLKIAFNANATLVAGLELFEGDVQPLQQLFVKTVYECALI